MLRIVDRPSNFIIAADQSVILDFLRAAAAFAVLIGHIKSFLLPNGPHSFPIKLIFMLIPNGKDAVSIFFVLSGFLVGKAAMQNFAAGADGARQYVVDRITRLHIVLVPALVLGFVADTLTGSLEISNQISNTPLGGYGGHSLNQIRAEAVQNLSLTTFFGNVLGLQTVLVEVFGSNGPLWSLANETWYYICFPLLLILLTWQRKERKLVAAALLLLAGVLLPKSIIIGGVLWLAGVATWWLPKIVDRRIGWAILALALLSHDFLDLNRSGVQHIRFICIAIGVSLVLAGRARGENEFFTTTTSLAAGFSAFSYSLYVFHFPMLLLVVAFTEKHVPSLVANELAVLPVTILIVLIVYAYSYAMYLLFEANYHRVRRGVRTWLAIA
jgi:peptidoglycan/LPS O-acetylase OafA/YrhL